MENCSICNAKIENEEPAILTLGGGGYPRYLCDECAHQLDEAGLSHDLETISAAMEGISDKVSQSDPDKVTYLTVTALLSSALERARKIQAGEYDFALDEEVNEWSFDEIPEELAETEEDKEKDRIDEEKQKKLDKFMNYVMIGAAIGFIGFLIWKIIDFFI